MDMLFFPLVSIRLIFRIGKINSKSYLLIKWNSEEFHPKVNLLKPLGFKGYVKLQMKAKAVLSDSGTITEESSILNFPAVTMRRSIERPEALDTGAIGLTGLDVDTLIEGVRIAVAQRDVFSGAEREIPEEYKIHNTSERVVRLITGTAKLTPHWKNMESFSRYDW